MRSPSRRNLEAGYAGLSFHFFAQLPPFGLTQTLVRLIARDRKETDAGDGVLEISELHRSLKVAVEGWTSGRPTPWIERRNMVVDAPLF